MKNIYLSSIFIPESIKKPHSVSGILKLTKSVLAISGIEIGENFPRFAKFLAVEKITDPDRQKLTFLARNVTKIRKILEVIFDLLPVEGIRKKKCIE